jgi:MFS family permease
VDIQDHNPGVQENPASGGARPVRKVWTAGTLTYTTSGLVALFAWLLWGDFTWSLKERLVPGVLQLLLKRFGATDTLTAILIGTLPGAIAMILGPIISYKSDRHRGRWGRRIPFLLIPTPVAVAAMVGLAFSPILGGMLHHAMGGRWNASTCVLCSLGLFWAMFEVSAITANSVIGALINDVVPQPLLGRFYGFFRALSLIAGILFYLWGFGKAEVYYTWIFLGMGALYGLGFTLMCLKVKEGEYPPPPVETDRPSFLSAASIYFRDCFANPYYVLFFLVSAFSWMSSNPVTLFSIYFAKAQGMNMNTYGTLSALTFVISLLLAYPIGALADRIHPLRASLIALALYSTATLWGGIFATNTWNFGIALVAHGVLSGSWMTASASLAQRLLPRLKFAELGSAGGIVITIANMCVAPLVGMFLDHVGHVYRYTYFISSGLSFTAFLLGLVLLRKFQAYGGTKNYVAP